MKTSADPRIDNALPVHSNPAGQLGLLKRKRSGRRRTRGDCGSSFARTRSRGPLILEDPKSQALFYDKDCGSREANPSPEVHAKTHEKY